MSETARIHRLLSAAREQAVPAPGLRRLIAAAVPQAGVASNAMLPPPPDPTDELVRRKVAILGEAYSGAMVPFRDALLASNSAEDAVARVQAAFAEWSPARVQRLVEEALQISAAAGAAGADVKPKLKNSGGGTRPPV
jgi:hypothetical protein